MYSVSQDSVMSLQSLAAWYLDEMLNAESVSYAKHRIAVAFPRASGYTEFFTIKPLTGVLMISQQCRNVIDDNL